MEQKSPLIVAENPGIPEIEQKPSILGREIAISRTPPPLLLSNRWYPGFPPACFTRQGIVCVHAYSPGDIPVFLARFTYRKHKNPARLDLRLRARKEKNVISGRHPRQLGSISVCAPTNSGKISENEKEIAARILRKRRTVARQLRV